MNFKVFNTCGLLILACLLSAPLIQASTIYKRVNEDGSVTYSDRPFEGAKMVVLPRINTVESIQTPPPTATQLITKNKHTVLPTLSVISPANELTIRDNSGSVTIVSSLSPSLSGHYRLTLNSKLYESQSGVFEFINLDRGTYDYTIQFLNHSGKVIALTPVRRFYLHRTSVLIN